MLPNCLPLPAAPIYRLSIQNLYGCSSCSSFCMDVHPCSSFVWTFIYVHHVHLLYGCSSCSSFVRMFIMFIFCSFASSLGPSLLGAHSSFLLRFFLPSFSPPIMSSLFFALSPLLPLSAPCSLHDLVSQSHERSRIHRLRLYVRQLLF